MKMKNLAILAAVAAAAVAAACLTGSGSKTRAPRLAGERLVGDFDLSEVASIEIGDSLKLAAGEGTNGWTAVPAQETAVDRDKVAKALLKLTELKVGQVARGRKLAEPLKVTVRDAAGKELAAVTLGEKHEKWNMGRYAEFKGETVLIGDRVDEISTDPAFWCLPKPKEEPKAEEVKATEEPKTEEPKAEEPKTEEAKPADGPR